jgi:hypothetical protein
MTLKINHKITARLPEALRIRLKREAEENLCSASDVVRKALLSFFGAECLTIAAESGDMQEGDHK